MKPKLLYLIKMLIVGLWLMLLAKLSYAQDSTQVNQIGFIVQMHMPVLEFEKDSTSHWTFKMVKDTLWFNENEPIALPSNYEKVLWRRKWLNKIIK